MGLPLPLRRFAASRVEWSPLTLDQAWAEIARSFGSRQNVNHAWLKPRFKLQSFRFEVVGLAMASAS